MQNEIQRIISGKSEVRYGATIQTAINYLKASEKSSTLDKADKCFKREETAKLKKYIENQNLWVKDIDLNNYVSEDYTSFYYKLKIWKIGSKRPLGYSNQDIIALKLYLLLMLIYMA